jgi:tetratricopeptide (TPR) repeat protein
VFIDATPPLAQWNAVEPAEDFATSRRLQLRWTAHDDNLGSRPVSLSYQSSIDQAWHTIDDAVANTGLYDWKVPENVGGQITLKLLVRDQGGQTVERPFGPLALSKIAAKAISNEPQALARPGSPEPARADTRPANVAISSTAPANVVNARAPRLTESPGLLPDLPATATRPGAVAKSRVDLVKQRMAADLYRQGSWHLERGQYAVAAERLRESLEHDPDLQEAHRDLAGIFYRQQDYDRAISEYQAVLSRNANHESALYGSALAYVAKRDYSQTREMLTRLLAVNDRNAEAWLDLGDVLFMMGDVINARANWRQAAKVDPSAQEVVTKAQRRLEQYGANDEVARK